MILKSWAVEMSQWLGALAVLPEDPCEAHSLL